MNTTYNLTLIQQEQIEAAREALAHALLAEDTDVLSSTLVRVVGTFGTAGVHILYLPELDPAQRQRLLSEWYPAQQLCRGHAALLADDADPEVRAFLQAVRDDFAFRFTAPPNTTTGPVNSLMADRLENALYHRG